MKIDGSMDVLVACRCYNVHNGLIEGLRGFVFLILQILPILVW